MSSKIALSQDLTLVLHPPSRLDRQLLVDGESGERVLRTLLVGPRLYSWRQLQAPSVRCMKQFSRTTRQMQIIPVQTLIPGLSRGLLQLQGIRWLGVKKFEAYGMQVLRVCNGQALAASNFSVLIPCFALVANAGHHDWCFSASFSASAWLAAHIAVGDAFSVEKNKNGHRPTHGLCPRLSCRPAPLPIAVQIFAPSSNQFASYQG